MKKIKKHSASAWTENSSFFEVPVANATTRLQRNDVRELALQFLTTACDNQYMRLIQTEINGFSGGGWSPVDNQEALKTDVNFALQTPEQWAASSNPAMAELTDADESDPNPSSLFMDDPDVRQSAYTALGLGAYADWLERAISGGEDDTRPASAQELIALMDRHEKGTTERARQNLRLGAESLYQPNYTR